MNIRRSDSVSRKLDLSSVIGLGVAVASLGCGFIFEGSHIKDFGQGPALFLVLGGTLAAVLLATPTHVFLAATQQVPNLIWEPQFRSAELALEITNLARQAKHSGFISLESDLEHISNSTLRKAMTLLMENADEAAMKKVMDRDLALTEERGESVCTVFEDAAGYAPTLGIVGSAIGLIRVMKMLQDPSVVGEGICLALVATVYGLLLANILFMPASNKLRARLKDELLLKELAVEGAIAIFTMVHPLITARKLDAYRCPMREGPLPDETISPMVSTKSKRSYADKSAA